MKDKLKILQIAHVNVPINSIEGGCGGLEEVIGILDKGYIKEGHDSFVIASTDSKISGKLCPTIPSLYGPGKEHLKSDIENIQRGFDEHCKKILEIIKDIKPDIIHDHTGYHLNRSVSERLFDPNWGLRTLNDIKNDKLPPVINTLHGYLTSENINMYKKFKNLFEGRVYFNAVSQFQRSIFRDILDVDCVIHNAIDVDSYNYMPKGKGYVFNMSSIYPGKGTHTAIDIALKNKTKIIVAGPYYSNKIYFEEKIKPKIDRTELKVPAKDISFLIDDFLNSKDRVMYLGEIGSKEKRIIYSNADAFLFPVTIDETFGLVSAEANASGVPVLSYLSGGIPEVVKHGYSGFTVKRGDSNQLLSALENVKSISRQNCRKWVNDNFRSDRQINDFLKFYDNVMLR